MIAYPDGLWRWKDEAEFARRLGIDTAEHQAWVRAAGQEFIHRFEQNEWPFNLGWQEWKPEKQYLIPILPENWNADFDTHSLLLNCQ